MSDPSLTETAWSHCEVVIRQFETAWRLTGRPDLAAFLPAHSPVRTRLLVELVHIDLEFRLRANEDARVEDYLERFPELSGQDLTLDLITAEYALRARHRPPVSPAEYWLRFPKHEVELRALLTASAPHQGLMQTRAAGTDPQTVPTGPPLIPGCQIIGELGRGGMGVVYQARDLLLNRIVAIKTLATMPAAETRTRFAREAESIARLDHPNIVPVYDVGEWGPEAGPRVPFFSMKWYPGGSLDTAPAGIGSDPRHQACLIETIAAAVHHAHRRGVLHLDLKPSNILLDDRGQPHVADFGLAGWFDPTDPRSIVGGAVGTPAYMAPEQAQAGRVTLAADIYGLGAVLYHLLTGRPPVLGASAIDTLERVIHTRPDPPTRLNPAIPLDLEAICLKCLEKDPLRRYATAGDLVDDLARFRTGRPIQARPTAAPERLWRLLRRHPLMTGLGALTLLALCIAVVTLTISNAQIRDKESEAQLALQRERDSRLALSQTLEREQRMLDLERVCAAGRLVQMNHLEQAWHSLDKCTALGRHWEWDYLDRLRRSAPTRYRGNPNGVYALAWLPDDRLVSVDVDRQVRVWTAGGASHEIPIAATRAVGHPVRPWVALIGDTELTIWDVDARKSLRQFPGREWAGFSPDGSILAQAHAARVILWKTDTWERLGELNGHQDWVSAGVFTHKGQRLITGGRDRTLRIWDLSSRTPIGEPILRSYPILTLALTSDDRHLIEAMPSRFQISDAHTGQIVRAADTAPGWPDLATGPDPSWFASNTTTGEIAIRDVVQGHILRTYRGHATTVFGVTLNRDGTRLASCDGDGTIRITDPTRTPEFVDLVTSADRFGSLTQTTDGQTLLLGPRPLHHHTEEPIQRLDPVTGQVRMRIDGSGEAALDPQGRWIVAGKRPGRLVVWDAKTGTETRTLAEKLTSTRIRFSPDGRYLAAADLAKVVRVWSTATWVEIPHRLATDGPVYSLAWHPTRPELAVTRNTGVEIWDMTTGTRTGWIATTTAPVTVAYHPNGELLAVAGRSRLLTLHSVATGQPVRPFIGNPIVINAMAFHPKGNRLVTAGVEGRLSVWDVDTGQELLALAAGDKDLEAVLWSPDGESVYALGRTLRRWTCR